MKLLTITAVLLWQVASIAGQAGKGGYFQNTETVSKHVEIVRAYLSSHITGIEPENFNKIIKKYTDKALDQLMYSEVIKNVKQAPLDERTRVNADGFYATLELDYSIEKMEIYLLKPFFEVEVYKQAEHTEEIFTSIALKLLHEATHVFGIGVENDEDSYQVARGLLSFLLKKQNSISFHKDVKLFRGDCGRIGSVSFQIDSCNQQEESLDVKLQGVRVFRISTIPINQSVNFWGDRLVGYVDSVNYAFKFYKSSQALNVHNIGQEEIVKNYCSKIDSNLKLPNLNEARDLAKKISDSVYYLDSKSNLKVVDSSGAWSSRNFFNYSIDGYLVCL